MGTIRYIGIVLTVLAIVFIPASVTRGTINFITLTLVTPADNPTTLSTGSGYYLAGKTYSFQINVIDPDITGWAQLTDVSIAIPNTANIAVSLNPSGTGVNLPVTVSSGSVNAVADVTGTYNNCTVTFKITFRWDTPESAYTPLRVMTASSTTTIPAVNIRTTTRTVSYGVCSSVKIINFAQDGVAADAMVNPWHDAFNVVGAVVYNVTGATISDKLERIDAGEITGTTLYVDGNATIFSDNVVDNTLTADLSYAVSAQFISGLAPILGNHTWTVRVSMATAGASEGSANSLALNCDRVEVTAITFINGGGVDAPSYYRSITVPGTQVRVTARMQNGGGNVVGNTTVTVRDVTGGVNFDVLIANGQASGVGDVTVPVAGGGNVTTLHTYRMQAVTDGAHGGDTAPNGQSNEIRIQQPANPQIYWDDLDPPGSNTVPFTGGYSFSQTAFSLTFNWTALTTGGPDFDGDFYTYRLYYKQDTSATWLIIDRNTTGYASLGVIGTGTVTVENLTPVTNYNFYITAVDVFGNEVAAANFFPVAPFDTAATVASTINVSITDGIDSFDDNSFTANALSSARLLRKTAIRISLFIVGAGDLPDSANIIVIPNVADPSIDGSIIAGGVLTGTAGTDYYVYSSIKTGPNQWTAYIPDTNPLINVGNNVGFIIELVRGGVPSYVDHNSESETPATANPNDYEWTFRINSAPTFTPWPTRVLNNVLTNENPICYPSYYLTDDAYVSIKAYDIKGRPIATLLDNVYRKGGQNIKEGGWRGNNRSNKKLGVGLYYLHFKATRASDGQVILNSFKKVVMAR